MRLSMRLLVLTTVAAGVVGYTPDIDHRAIAGLWKLIPKQKKRIQFPMKEFTVYPKDPKQNQWERQKFEDTLEQQGRELLLMLKEDGSFQQYASEVGDESDEAEPARSAMIPDKMKYHGDKNEDEILDGGFLGAKIEGKWDFVDGKLILAADRPVHARRPEDTILVGRVVATSEQSLLDNPVVSASDGSTSSKEDATPAPPTPPDQGSSRLSSPITFDTHLSVPKGRVNVGKFCYPKTHPSFFEQPMFDPKSRGIFELKQVLGALNAKQIKQQDEMVEKFRQKDFYGKRFLLTSHPIGQHRAKGQTRWSIKYNKFVEEPPSKAARKAAEEEEKRPVNIRVMEVQFFANNTFATVSGLGDAILRGKFHIVGNGRDHLWMQVWRFGFGRSVSGSVYSEGRMLTKEDEKTYWGRISFEDENGEIVDEAEEASGTSKQGNERRLIVMGSVIYGYGLEPQPVGRFVMTETTGHTEEEEEEEDDDDDADEAEYGIGESNDRDDDFMDWSNAFQ